MKVFRTLLIVIVPFGILILSAESSFAQCAMCKAAIEASSDVAAASRGLNLAALVLLIPPVTIFAGLFGVFYRFRNAQEKRERPRTESY
jgi:heme/copper-type cytochrome/quinol oxidase subunit 3